MHLTNTTIKCRETLAPSLTHSKDAWRLGPYLWTHQYTHLSPSTCFVLDDGTGRAVGYCIGCPDIDAFIAAYDGYRTDVLDPSPEIEKPVDVAQTREPWTLPDGSINGVSMAQQAYNPSWLLVEGNEDVMRQGYRATMHIDLLEGWRAGGWGRKLIEHFVAAVRAARTPGEAGFRGIWIGIAADNAQVVKFYEKVGYRLVQSSPGGGPRMVMDL